MKRLAVLAVIAFVPATRLQAQLKTEPVEHSSSATGAHQAPLPDECRALARSSAVLRHPPTTARARASLADVSLTHGLAGEGPLVSVAGIQERRNSGSAIFAGVVVGAVVGGVVGRQLAGNGCSRGASSCDTPIGIPLFTVGGVLFGGALGGVVAWLWTDRDR